MNDMFYPGQDVFADGRLATYAGHVAGRHYVHSIAGLVPAKSLSLADLGSPRQLQCGEVMHSRVRGTMRRNRPAHAVRPFPSVPHSAPLTSAAA